MNKRYYDNWLQRFWYDDAWRIKVTLITAAIILVLGGIWYVVIYRATVHAQVIDMSWELKIARLQYQTVQENDWSVPQGGRVTSTNSEFHHTHTYISSYKTVTIKGSTYNCGTSKKPKTCKHPDTTKREPVYSSYPVYQTKYYYDIDRWINIEPLVTSGKEKEDVHWPDTTDGDYNDNNVIGNVKLGTRHSHFQIIFLANGKTYPVDMVEGMWNTYGRGTKAILTLNFFGGVTAVEQKGW